MKRVLSIFAILVLISSVSFAQLGIKAGLNLGTFGGDDNKDPFTGTVTPVTRTGLTAGAYYNIGLVLGLSIQPGVSYTQKGAVYEFPAPISAKLTMAMDYIDIPVVVKWSPLPLPVVKPYVQGGLSYSILMSAKAKAEPGGETDIKDMMAKNDLSFIIGAGVDFDLFLLKFTVDARYVMGQTKLDKDGNAKAYNRGVQATVGVNF
jgi:opacity protein-like surface antigen